jgi:RNA-directed DNA polymerase
MNNYTTKSMSLTNSEFTRERERERVNPHLEVFSFQNLLRAYYQCRKNKRHTINAARFEMNFEKGLLKLKWELKNHTYQPGRSICFVITDPKPREVFAADFRDRIVHHLLVDYLEPIWEKKFIHYSYSCRQNKGAHCAVKDLKRFLRQASDNFSKPAYCLQADVSAFFMSLKKDILFNLIKRHTKNPNILWLTEQIIFHDPTKNYYFKGDPKLFHLIPPHKSLFKVPENQGLPIGNLTSQFFANVYLNELDQFAKHQLKIKYYLRYVDDLLILYQDADQLKLWQWKIDDFLQEKLKLHLHPQKSTIQPVHKGMNFVGFIVKPKYNLVRNRTVKKLKSKLWHFDQKTISLNSEHPIRLWTPELCGDFKEIFATVNSYYGQFRHANTFRLRRHLYHKHFKILKIYLKPVDKNYGYMVWDED